MSLDINVVAESLGQVHLVRLVGGVPHDLLRHAADVDAGAAQGPGLDHRRFDAVLRGALRVCEATASAANDDQVEIRCHYCVLPVFSRRRTTPL